MRVISAQEIQENSDPMELVEALRNGFQSQVKTPARHHHSYIPDGADKNSTLLIMPAWETAGRLGVKLVTVSPENGKINLPSIHGVYTVFDTKTGVPLAQLDGTTLTVKRTAAASALASKYLSRVDSATLLMVGTGALAPELIKAHCAVRPIRKVLVWGRNYDKAMAIANSLEIEHVKIEAVKDLSTAISQACIVSCATLSETPLVKGEFCKPGQHIDLVGAYLPSMRESDSELMQNAEIFVDTMQGARESGDINIPIEKGVIDSSAIKADLYSLCAGTNNGRSNAQEITVFKSVGHALEDLVAANYIYDKIQGK